MRALKIISLVASIFYSVLVFFVLFAFVENLFYFRQLEFPDTAMSDLYINMLIVLCATVIPAVINFAYYFFLQKRTKENRSPKYATSIALLLALAPVALYVGFAIHVYQLQEVLLQINQVE